ncbi:MAG: N-acetyl-gamma-glutamyl-phosphate reductase, partial [Alphaproteobacteria bacterium]|nr:N-acetyl-gamma-glutamyl-phosphate reductase [Alphaproteobacteria bacterium]
LMHLFSTKYADEPLITLQNEAPDLKQGAGRNGIIIGGFETSDDGKSAVIVAAEDNLLKGAAIQAIQNVNIALGLPEMTGITS